MVSSMVLHSPLYPLHCRPVVTSLPPSGHFTATRATAARTKQILTVYVLHQTPTCARSVVLCQRCARGRAEQGVAWQEVVHLVFVRIGVVVYVAALHRLLPFMPAYVPQQRHILVQRRSKCRFCEQSLGSDGHCGESTAGARPRPRPRPCPPPVPGREPGREPEGRLWSSSVRESRGCALSPH